MNFLWIIELIKEVRVLVSCQIGRCAETIQELNFQAHNSFIPSVCLSCLKPKFNQLFCLSWLNLRCPRTNKKVHSAHVLRPLRNKEENFLSTFFSFFNSPNMTKKSLNHQYGHFSTWHEYVTYVDCTASWRRKVVIENILIFLSLLSHFPWIAILRVRDKNPIREKISFK